MADYNNYRPDGGFNWGTYPEDFPGRRGFVALVQGEVTYVPARDATPIVQSHEQRIEQLEFHVRNLESRLIISAALGNAQQYYAPQVPVTPRPATPPPVTPQPSFLSPRRPKHSMEKSMVNAFARIPLMPLTDVEIIVFFYPALSRPNVALRLQARGWTPQAIVTTLHEHRVVDPPYLRNTCCVKINTALNKGEDMYGDTWKADKKGLFANADAAMATDMIRLTSEDADKGLDYDMRHFGVDLAKLPDGANAGTFTACVKYCLEKNVGFALSDVVDLAVDMVEGRQPVHPKASRNITAKPTPLEQPPRYRAGSRNEAHWCSLGHWASRHRVLSGTHPRLE